MNPLLRRRLPIIIVLVIVLVGLGLIFLGHWRRGSVVIGVAALVGSGLRVGIPERDVGVLAVRSKQFDIGFLVTIAAVFIGLAVFAS